MLKFCVPMFVLLAITLLPCCDLGGHEKAKKAIKEADYALDQAHPGWIYDTPKEYPDRAYHYWIMLHMRNLSKSVDGYKMEVHDLESGGDYSYSRTYYYEIISTNKTGEVITSLPTSFSSRDHAMQACDNKYLEVIKKEKS